MIYTSIVKCHTHTMCMEFYICCHSLQSDSQKSNLNIHVHIHIHFQKPNILYYYSYKAFGGQNKIVYSTAIILYLPDTLRKCCCKQTKWQPAVTHDHKIAR